MDIESARNLTCRRAARSVWDKRGWRGVTIEERVSPWLVSIAGAGLLVAPPFSAVLPAVDGGAYIDGNAACT